MSLTNIYQFLHKPVNLPEEIDIIEKSIINGEVIVSKIIDAGLKFDIIAKSSTILQEFVADNPDGYTDADITPVSLEKKYKLAHIGQNIFPTRGTNQFISTADGVLVVKENSAKIIPVRLDGYFEIKITEDNMKVYMDFYPPVKGRKKILIKEVFGKLKETLIETEIKTKTIENVLEQLDNSEKPVYNVLVAEGKIPEEGEDGYLEYLVNTDIDITPKITEDGRVDFYNINAIITVDENQELAVYHPHRDGVNGNDVYGHILEAKEVKKSKLPMGKNTKLKEGDPNTVVSKVSGNLYKKDNLLNISEVHVIKGNVDFATGNLETKASLKVMGDVKTGFRIDAGDMVEIKGVVEDSFIKAGGNVLISSGFTGSGGGVIMSEGNVELKYVRNQKIYAHGVINVLNEAIDSELYAKNRIQVTGGKNMAVFGGHLIAGNSVETNHLGNEYSVPTLVEVGYDYESVNQMNKFKYEITQLETTLETIEQGLKQVCKIIELNQDQRKALEILVNQKFIIFDSSATITNYAEQMKKIDNGIEVLLRCGSLQAGRIDNFKLLIDQRIKIRQKINSLKEESFKLEMSILEPSRARVKVNRRIFPGVTIMINKRKFVVTTEMLNKTFILSHQEDRVVMI